MPDGHIAFDIGLLSEGMHDQIAIGLLHLVRGLFRQVNQTAATCGLTLLTSGSIEHGARSIRRSIAAPTDHVSAEIEQVATQIFEDFHRRLEGQSPDAKALIGLFSKINIVAFGSGAFRAIELENAFDRLLRQSGYNAIDRNRILQSAALTAIGSFFWYLNEQHLPDEERSESGYPPRAGFSKRVFESAGDAWVRLAHADRSTSGPIARSNTHRAFPMVGNSSRLVFHARPDKFYVRPGTGRLDRIVDFAFHRPETLALVDPTLERNSMLDQRYNGVPRLISSSLVAMANRRGPLGSDWLMPTEDRWDRVPVKLAVG